MADVELTVRTASNGISEITYNIEVHTKLRADVELTVTTASNGIRVTIIVLTHSYPLGTALSLSCLAWQRGAEGSTPSHQWQSAGLPSDGTPSPDRTQCREFH